MSDTMINRVSIPFCHDTAAMAVVLIATPAPQAADDDDKAKARAGKMFTKLDKDSNGKVTLETFKALAKGDDQKAKTLHTSNSCLGRS